ncbi:MULTISPECIES: IclR family transcriptional regulator domain-containing protein [Delftia]|uniref:IclR family transcriptional regulator domain-containing protein n=1 Tax=Delftia TaxID=80865 RepID=UPI0004D4AA86|nr:MULTISPECIES: IclR family transcriptional regulator C-terminal domain-containing protein [Delftia]KEH13660.1 IclR family transcriptional regulator [Delftia sp. 670]MDC2859693.1 helix-turn-helix domain-containing protein [Delftia sp. DT-2]BDE69953.1 IclR family transcriptional regulator [Delftia lacustris]
MEKNAASVISTGGVEEEGGTPRPGDSYVQSFARGLGVIRSFSAEAPAQTLSEVAARTGLTRAGARRILLTLQTLGYVKSDGKLFQLTPRIMELGFAYLSSTPVWNLAEPVMENLVDEVKESCSAAVLDGGDIVYVLRVHTHKIMSTNLSVGSRLPACWTSMGRVLLAGESDESLQALLDARERRQFTALTEQDDERLRQRILEVRAQGWALVDQELAEGLISIAAPVKNAAGRTVAALNISGQANRNSAEMMRVQLLPRLLAATQLVSQLLRASSRLSL